jgi:hypothetical protein
MPSTMATMAMVPMMGVTIVRMAKTGTEKGNMP